MDERELLSRLRARAPRDVPRPDAWLDEAVAGEPPVAARRHIGLWLFWLAAVLASARSWPAGTRTSDVESAEPVEHVAAAMGAPLARAWIRFTEKP